MKRTTYTRNNITLEQSENGSWYLAVHDTGIEVEPFITVHQSEITDIVDTCIEMLLEWEKPPEGIRKSVA